VSGTSYGLDRNRTITQYVHEAWTTENGLPQSTVMAITQTPDGYLWFGTGFGLVRFDGVRFTVFNSRNTPALCHDDIRSLWVDRNGTLWIGTHREGLSQFHDGHFTGPWRCAEGLPDNYVTCFCEDRQGTVWIGTGAGLACVRNGQLESVAELSIWIEAVFEDRNGTIWISTRKGMFQFKSGRAVPLRDASGSPLPVAHAIVQDSTGNMWFATSNGVVQFQDGRQRRFGASDGLPTADVMSLMCDRDGNLWLGTFGGGLVRYQNGRFEAYRVRDGLSDDTVLSLFEDREGSLWVGTSNDGLNRFRNSLFVNYTMAEGFPGGSPSSICMDPSGGMWIGTDSDGLIGFSGGRWTKYTSKDGLPSDRIAALCCSAGGALWISTSAGMARLERGQLTSLKGKNGLPERGARALFEDREGNLLIADDSGLHRWRDGKLSTRLAEVFPSWIVCNILSIEQGADGTIWIGSVGGLIQLKDGYATRYMGLPSDVVYALYPDGNDLWFGTEGGYLHFLHEGTIYTFNLQDRVPIADVGSILADGAGSLWLVSSQGVLRLTKKCLLEVASGQRSEFDVRLFTRLDGLKTTEMNGNGITGIQKSKDGRLWFVSAKGLVAIDPTLAASSAPPSARIERLMVDDLGGVALDAAVIPPGKGKLEISYTAMTLLTPTRTRFHYKLEGFDDGWIDAGTRRVAYYTHLPPGHYEFVVQAANDDGEWGPECKALELDVRPHFYQTYWFYGSCALGLAFVGAGGHLARVRHLRSRQATLAACVADRTRELRAEVAEHQRTSEHLRVAKEAAEQAARAKSAFLANMSHEIRTPMNGVLGMAELVLDTELSCEQRHQLGLLRTSAESLLRIINDILDFSKIEAGKLDLDRASFSIRDTIDDVLAPLRLRADQKELKLSCNVEGDVPDGLVGDPLRLQQVLTNLVSNAIKFTEDGEVSIRARLDAADGEMAVVHFTVSDTGIGIPKDKQQLIFEAFTQADSSTTRQFGGTGLGLAIASQLVQMMGGRLAVQSEAGVGSSFSFTARFGRSAEPQSDSARSLATAREGASVTELSALRILLAEDNEINQEIAVRILEKRGHTVTVCKNGQEVVNSVSRQNFDVVLMDVQMPVMDGLSATKLIREREKDCGRHIPIIALTAHAMKGDSARCLAAGMDAYVSKPLRPNELFETLAQVTRGLAADRASSFADKSTTELVFDEGEALAQVDGDRDLLVEMFRLFTEQSSALLTEMRDAIASSESRSLERAAHKLKGSAAYFAARSTVHAALQLEIMGREGNFRDAQDQYEALTNDVTQFLQAFQEFAARQSGTDCPSSDSSLALEAAS
jgi:signal transduction histidine kinase/ligand-binding sensor domain-containing protein/CheY-like chemotaxis protein/HPt (histidine-containing phosphotransfer) domain-containing protein